MSWFSSNTTTTITPTTTSNGVYTINAASAANGGYYISSNNVINNQNASIKISGNLEIDTSNPYVNTKKHKINIDKLYENIQLLNEMFHIIVPDFDKFEKNPTLLDAYQQYHSAKQIEPRYNSEQYIAAYHQFKLLEALFEEEKNDNS